MFACTQGWADCDGEIANGCEESLDAEDPCAECPAQAAMRCLHPELCGLDAPVCTPADGIVWSSMGTIVESEISSLAVGPSGERVFATTSRDVFDPEKEVEPSPGATLFGVDMVDDGGLAWAALGHGPRGRIHRFGERLYLHSAGAIDEQRVTAFSPDGEQLWTSAVPNAGAAIHHSALAVDAAGNVYITGEGPLVVSLDAMGEERWRYDLAYLSHGACRGFGDGKVHDLRVVEDKLIGVNDGCLLELDRDSGEIVKEQLLYAQAVEGRLRSDEQGGLYVADVAASGSILPLPNYLDATSDPSDQLTTGRVNLFVSKYTKELEHVWTRSFASVGSYGTDELHAPTLRGFDMSRDGIGYLLGFGGEHPFLIRFDADGKALDTMIILNRLYPTHQLAVSDDGSPYLAGTSKTTVEGVKTGMFIWFSRSMRAALGRATPTLAAMRAPPRRTAARRASTAGRRTPPRTGRSCRATRRWMVVFSFRSRSGTGSIAGTRQGDTRGAERERGCRSAFNPLRTAA